MIIRNVRPDPSLAVEVMEPISQPTREQVEEYDKAFGQRLRDLRDERGLKPGCAAKELGIHYNTIKNWKLGTAWPGAKELLHLAKVYDIDPKEFFIGVNK